MQFHNCDGKMCKYQKSFQFTPALKYEVYGSHFITLVQKTKKNKLHVLTRVNGRTIKNTRDNRNERKQNHF